MKVDGIEAMMNINKKELGLALIFIEYDKQYCKAFKNDDKRKTGELFGFNQGILMATELLGVKDFYGTITCLRNALKEG